MFDIKATETDHCIYNIKWELILLTAMAVSVQRFKQPYWLVNITDERKSQCSCHCIVLISPFTAYAWGNGVPRMTQLHLYKHNSTSVGNSHLPFHLLPSAQPASEIHRNYFVETSTAASSLSYKKSKYTYIVAPTLPNTYQNTTSAHFPTLSTNSTNKIFNITCMPLQMKQN
jgi:hypothetical protein